MIFRAISLHTLLYAKLAMSRWGGITERMGKQKRRMQTIAATNTPTTTPPTDKIFCVWVSCVKVFYARIRIVFDNV